jgi:hypothetical protein
MYGSILSVAAVLVGIDVGWRPLPEGGVEYLIQIEPELLETLESGSAVESDIPPSVTGVRAYRITVGAGELPRELPEPEAQPFEPGANPDAPEAQPGAAGASRLPGDLSGVLPPLDRGALEPAEKEPSRLGASSPLSGFPLPPHRLEPDPGSQPIATQTAALVDQAETEPTPDTKPKTGQKTSPKETAKPWMPFTLVLFGLFASLGGNVFLGWVAYESRSRYRALRETRSP